MIYTKNQSVQGKWVNKKEVKSGSKCQIVSETKRMPSNFKNDDGSVSEQDVCKVLFAGESEAVNLAINRPSLNALIDAFGEDSLNWQKKPLTAVTEKTVVGGKRGVALYLVPEGYEVTEDAGGYVVIAPNGEIEGEEISLDDEPVQDNPLL